ncbi:hypothetical protein QQG55_5800 [Brugia pahangi]
MNRFERLFVALLLLPNIVKVLHSGSTTKIISATTKSMRISSSEDETQNTNRNRGSRKKRHIHFQHSF